MSAARTKAGKHAAAVALRAAEAALVKAKERHRQAFRAALVQLFNEFGLQLEATGTEGARLEIADVRPGPYRIEDLPE